MRSTLFMFHGHCILPKSGTGLHYVQNFGHPEGMIVIAVSWVVFALRSTITW